MPSQRDKEKRMFGVYLDKRQRKALKRLADKKGITMASYFKFLVMNEAERQGVMDTDED